MFEPVKHGKGKIIIILFYLNAKDINTIVKALRTTNSNTTCDFAAGGFIKM